jgi:hypothetical protein
MCEGELEEYSFHPDSTWMKKGLTGVSPDLPEKLSFPFSKVF